jgi:hypothetical protein
MSLVNSSGGNTEISETIVRKDILSRYKQLRRVSQNLNNKLVQRLSKDILYEGGRSIGILKGGKLVFDSMDESAVLMDYCIYDVRQSGRNAIEQYLVLFPADLESDESVCLRAMQHAVYSVFMVESVERDLGVTVRDLRTDEIHFVVDIGLAATAEPGLVVASRLLFLDGFSMSTGAALPIGVLPTEERASLAKKVLAAVKTDDNGHFDPAPLIRSCLRKGCSSRVRYQEPGQGGMQASRQTSGWPEERLPTIERSARVGRNEPCPCGSGRKFKQCCLKIIGRDPMA